MFVSATSPVVLYMYNDFVFLKSFLFQLLRCFLVSHCIDRPLHGFGRHLGCGAVAALHVRFAKKMCLLKGNDMEILSLKQEEEFTISAFVNNI